MSPARFAATLSQMAFLSWQPMRFYWFTDLLFQHQVSFLPFIKQIVWKEECPWNPCTFAPIGFWFQIENTKSELLCFSIFKYNLKIKNHPFLSDFRFFSCRFVAKNAILKINFFQKISIFNFPFFISLLPIENGKMKIFELLILI